MIQCFSFRHAIEQRFQKVRKKMREEDSQPWSKDDEKIYAWHVFGWAQNRFFLYSHFLVISLSKHTFFTFYIFLFPCGCISLRFWRQSKLIYLSWLKRGLKLVAMVVAGRGNHHLKLLGLWATAVHCPNSKKYVGLYTCWKNMFWTFQQLIKS